MLESRQLGFERADRVERRQRRVEHGLAGRADDLLRQVADGRSLRDADLAAVRLDLPGDDAQQRRLAGPVRADQTDPLARDDGPVDVTEHDLRAVLLGHADEREHNRRSLH